MDDVYTIYLGYILWFRNEFFSAGCQCGRIKSRGLRVNVLSPGGVYHPGRPQTPASGIGGAVMLLLRDAASYISGANRPADGGSTTK